MRDDPIERTPSRAWVRRLLAGSAALILTLEVVAARAPSQPLVKTLWPQADPVSGLAYDGSSLWITLDGRPLIQEADPDTGAVRRSFPFATADTGGSAWDGRWLWQIAYLDRTIHKIDVRTGQVVARIATPGEGLCSGMTFDGTHLWVANFDDRRVYAIDPNQETRILRSLEGHFETTGLAWDGRYLWSGILVGTKTHDEPTPRTGFVEQTDLATRATLSVVPVPGVGPGTSDWLPGASEARRFWWYDGYNRRIVRVELPRERSSTPGLAAGALLLLAVCLATPLSAPAPRSQPGMTGAAARSRA